MTCVELDHRCQRDSSQDRLHLGLVDTVEFYHRFLLSMQSHLLLGQDKMSLASLNRGEPSRRGCELLISRAHPLASTTSHRQPCRLCMLRTPSGLFSHLARSSFTSPTPFQSPRLVRSVMLVSDRQITLTAEEDRLCSLLDDFKAHVQQTEPESPQVECRIAGGWVRDKVRQSLRRRRRKLTRGEGE